MRKLLTVHIKVLILLQKKPMPLPTVREADMFWSQQIWRIIDVREKMNQTLYYPSAEINGRVNLINLLLKGIENGQITPYDASINDDEFTVPIDFNEVKEKFGATTRTRKKKSILILVNVKWFMFTCDIRPEEVNNI